MILMDINGVRAVIRKQDVLTAGMVGQQVEFRFDESWDKMGKTAVFRAGDVTKDVAVTNSIAKVPHEVLIPGVAVEIGVYGSKDDGAIVIPTVWAKTNIVEFGADPSGDESVDPTLPIWGQLQEELAEIKESGSVGGITEEDLNAKLEDYATIEYVEQTVPSIVDGELRNQIEPLIEEVTEKVLESIEIPEGGGITEEQLAETLEEAKSYTNKVTASFSDDIESLNTRVDALSDTCAKVEENAYGFLTGDEFVAYLDENMEHIVENVISALPIYDGEVVE